MIWLSFLAGLGLAFLIFLLIALISPRGNKDITGGVPDSLILQWEISNEIGRQKVLVQGRIANCLEEYTK